MSGVKNLTGLKFGRLTVIRTEFLAENAHKPRNRRLVCKCDCGNSALARVDHLQSGKTKSCGCIEGEIIFAKQMTALAADLSPMMRDAESDAKEWQTYQDGLLSDDLRETHPATPCRATLGTRVETLAGRAYKLQPGERERRLAEQQGRCAICGATEDAEGLHIDHDHVTGRIRGLLCRACNIGLGFFRDDIMRLAKAAKYLSDSLQAQ